MAKGMASLEVMGLILFGVNKALSPSANLSVPRVVANRNALENGQSCFDSII